MKNIVVLYEDLNPIEKSIVQAVICQNIGEKITQVFLPPNKIVNV